MKDIDAGPALHEDVSGRFWKIGAPIVFGVLYLFIGLFFLRPGMGDPDSYRQALSALTFLDESAYSSYWDFPVTMYVFVAGTWLASIIGLDQLTVLNAVAVLLGAVGIWPLYQVIRRLAGRRTAAFASVAYILSPTLIRYSTYLSHEIVGFAFAIWSFHLFERALARGDRRTAFAFGFLFGAACAARTNGAVFIVPPLAVLFIHEIGRLKPSDIGRLLLFALLGFFACLLLAHRPDTVLRFKARLDVWFFTYYEIGRFIGRTTLTMLQSLTPALVAATAVGAGLLVSRRKYFIVLLGGIWILTVYLFYAGMDICRPKFFLVLLPPCMLLVFAGADQLDDRFRFGRERSPHAVKLAVVMLLVLAGLGPSLPQLLYIRNSNDDALIARGIGRVAGGELLFTTSLKPMIDYYNRDNPPETVYLITELKPGTLEMNADALRLAQRRLGSGRPVYATGLILEHFKHLNIDVNAESVWEYKSLRLFHLTRMDVAGINAALY